VFRISAEEKDIELKPSVQAYQAASHLLLLWKFNGTDDDRDKLVAMCRYMLVSIESESPKMSYIGVALNKDHSLLWITHMKKFLLKCCHLMDSLKPELHSDSVTLSIVLSTLVNFTCPNSWAILRNKQLAGMKAAMQQICNNILGYLIQKGFFLYLRNITVKGTLGRSVVTLKPLSINALMTLAIRPLVCANFTQNLLTQFICQILSIPALIYQLPDEVSCIMSPCA